MDELVCELKELQDRQKDILDGYRVFMNGSIKTATFIDDLNTGWYNLADPVDGARKFFQNLFPNQFLKVENIRAAINLRDKMIRSIPKASEPISEPIVESDARDSDTLPVLL